MIRYFRSVRGFGDETALVRFDGEAPELMYQTIRPPEPAEGQHLRAAERAVDNGVWREIDEAEARRTYPAAFVFEDMKKLRWKTEQSCWPADLDVEIEAKLALWVITIEEVGSEDW